MAQHRHQSGFRSRKFIKNIRKISIVSILVILSIIVFFSVLAYHHLSREKELDTFHSHDDENLNRIESDRRRDHVGYNVDDFELVDGNDNVNEDVKKSGGTDGSGFEQDMEGGRNELKLYEAEFEASLKNVGQSTQENSYRNNISSNGVVELQNEEDDSDGEYDDAIDSQDARVADHEDVRNKTENQIDDIGESHGEDNAKESEKAFTIISMDETPKTLDEVITDSRPDSNIKGRSDNRSVSERGSDSRRPTRHHRVTGSTCEIKFLNSTAQLVEPSESTKFSRFSLQYTDVEERPIGQEQWKPRFAGHQSLKEREESFYAQDQTINCGFIEGPKGSFSTGFDLEDDDVRYMSSCHIAVSSCIFGNSDNLRSPFGKTVTRLSRKNVCFVTFMDERTLQTLSSEGQKPDKFGFIGFWKVVVVNNLPFADMRRVGKIPKFLAHRLFPSARYSIWLDSKLRLQSDPLLILEYFLWRKGHEYAISKHYNRHCVWEEVAQNKRLNKFNHTIIDQQFIVYQADGLKRFNASDPNKLLPSNVPEGSLIVRAHTPMSNLFSCLWFNEVDRFTPRDQLSFAYVYHKLRRMNPEKPFYFNMFKDCERRAIAKLFRHRSEQKRNISFQATG